MQQAAAKVLPGVIGAIAFHLTFLVQIVVICQLARNMPKKPTVHGPLRGSYYTLNVSCGVSMVPVNA